MNPTVNWFHPDKDFKQFAELKNVEQNDMVLLHEDDSHYNLIVSKESDLAKQGSLSYRFNVGPLMVNEEDKVTDTSDDKQEDEEETLSLTELKKELKKSKDEKKKLQVEYINCIKELRVKTEEAEMLKSELNDLKEIVKLDKLLAENDEDIQVDGIEKEKDFEERELLKMKKRGSQRRNPQCEPNVRQFPTPKPKGLNQPKEKEFNCGECDYQCTKEIELNKHVNLKHKVSTNNLSGTIICRNCGDQFTSKWNLMTHRKSKHSSTVAQCRNYLGGKCDYSDNMCWWNHAEKVVNLDDNIKCFMCSKVFERKNEMMVHRKKYHPENLRQCKQFQSNACRFKEESCWFIHQLEKDTVHSEEKMETDSVFQKVSQNLVPPLYNKNKTVKN